MEGSRRVGLRIEAAPVLYPDQLEAKPGLAGSGRLPHGPAGSRTVWPAPGRILAG